MHVLYPLQGKVLNLSFKTHGLIYILDIVTQCILLLTIKWKGHADTSKERDSRNKNSIILKKTYLAYLIKHLKDKRLEQDNRKAAKGVWVHYCQENFEILNHWNIITSVLRGQFIIFVWIEMFSNLIVTFVLFLFAQLRVQLLDLILYFVQFSKFSGYQFKFSQENLATYTLLSVLA